MHSLSRELTLLGHEVDILASAGGDEGQYSVDDIRVHSLPSVVPDSSVNYTLKGPVDPQFEALLTSLKPDIVHIHELGRNIGLSHLEIIEKHGFASVITHHQPGFTCLQRSLMFRGETPCDGRIDSFRCTQCRLSAFARVPRGLDWLMATADLQFLARHLPPAFSPFFSARRNIEVFKAALREVFSRLAAVHVLTDWGRDVLLRNGIPLEKIHLLRTGLPAFGQEFLRKSSKIPNLRSRSDEAPLRIVYWGRLNYVKGVHIIIEAMRRLKDDRIQLLIIGGGDKRYTGLLKELAGDDSRISFAGLLSRDQLPEVVAREDICIIPSLWYEAGPLTVLEAQALGLPIIGTRLGGIAELLGDGRGAILFPPGDVAKLSQILEEIVCDRSKLLELTQCVQSPRTMRDLAFDVEGIYRKLVS